MDDFIMVLSADELERFKRDGCLIFDGLLKGETLKRYKSILDEMVDYSKSLDVSTEGYCLQPDKDGKDIPGRLFKVQGCCVLEPRLLEIANDPDICSRARDLIGSDMHIFGTKFFPMLPKGGTSTSFHTDNYYFETDSDKVLSCGIYYEDTSLENACLSVLKGSHTSGDEFKHVSGKGEYSHGDWLDVDEDKVFNIECPAGTVVLFSANLVHGAGQNNSNRTRYSTAWHYIPDDLELDQFPFGEYSDRYAVR
ncbi:MAG: phytanoyl-CoA dioxygenase family protein [Lentisphaeria bacterium]|nr:phytanoyl-CoA dioxygenase family protein [Lentisphaeria bacterium]NQZ70715.1 phytanoyl-CoA dioxygenase family protein [Lentisphaeria bacterium]